MRRLIRVLVATALIPLLASGGGAAIADSGSFEDSRCDVRGYDWFAGEHINRSCKEVGIDKVAFGMSRNGIYMQATLDDNFPNGLRRNEQQSVWLDVDRDKRPDYLVKIRYDGGALFRVRSFASARREVSCSGDRYGIGIITERMIADVPRSCVGQPRNVRISVRTLVRYDDGKSTWRDTWPNGARWSTTLGI